MKEIRVLQFGLSNNYGGLESFVKNMYEHIDRSKVKFDFVDYSNHQLAYYNYYKKEGCTIYQIVRRNKNPLKSYKQLKKIIIEGKYDYIHMNVMNYNWMEPLKIANKYSPSTKVILHSHIGASIRDNLKDIILNYFGKKSVRKMKYLKLACSINSGKYLFGSNDFTVIENGINEEEFEYNLSFRKKIRQKYGVQDDEILVGHVGNFSYQKNYPLLLKIFLELKKKNLKFKLILIGDDTKAIKEREFINNNNLQRDVIFCGMVKDVNEIYSAMDIFLFPSLYEGFSIAMVEAQCSGLMCFISNTLKDNCNIGGNYYSIDITELPRNIADKICCEYSRDYDRKVKISDRYLASNSAKKLEKFYIENIEGVR